MVQVAGRSSALEGMKVGNVTATAVEDPADLTECVCKIGEVDGDDYDKSDGTEDKEEEEEAALVIAGVKALRFSELLSEFDGEADPAPQYHRHEEMNDVAEITAEARNIKQVVSKVPRKLICMMAGREKLDFVGTFRKAPVTILNCGSFFDFAPSVKRDICHLLVKEPTKGLNKAKMRRRRKGKKVPIEEVGKEALAVATDRDVRDVSNFNTKGIVHTDEGGHHISTILVDARSVGNLMPIHLL